METETARFTNPAELRLAIRRGEWTRPTRHQAPGYVQCSVVILPRADAFDFLRYCQRNPKACPLIEVLEPGAFEPRLSAPGADLRTDVGRYAVYRNGAQVDEVTDLRSLWREDHVSFLIGSSLSFDPLLESAGIPPSPVWVLETKLPTVPSGSFHGPLAVTMRWMSPPDAISAILITGRAPNFHGAPVHLGDPAAIGANIAEPLYGPALAGVPSDRTALYWACGVTPQRAALASGTPFMITHVAGCGFVTDLRIERFTVP
jgi:uncharacterized protein YcsI (UPF0317 family)